MRNAPALVTGLYVVLADGVGLCDGLIEGPTTLWLCIRFDDQSVEFHDAEDLFDHADFYSTKEAALAALATLATPEAANA